MTGSELIGLIPLQAMLDAGNYYQEKQDRCSEVPDAELIKTATHALGLEELAPFDPDAKIMEYALARRQ